MNGADNDPQTMEISCTLEGAVPGDAKEAISRLVIGIDSRDKDFQAMNRRL